MAARPQLRKSLTERLLAGLVVTVSLVLIGWVAFDLLKSANAKRPAAPMPEIYDLSSARGPVIVDSSRRIGGATEPDPAGQIEPTRALMSIDGLADDQEPALGQNQTASELPSAVLAGPTFDEFQEVSQQLDIANETIAELQAEIKSRDAEWKQIQQVSSAEIDSLSESNAGLQQENANLEAKIASLANQLASARAQTRRAANQLAAIENQEREAEITQQSTSDFLSAARAAFEEADFARAEAIWRDLSKQGQPRAQFLLGKLYFEGQLGSRNLPEAFRQLTAAIRSGFGPALPLREQVKSAMTVQQLAEARGN